MTKYAEVLRPEGLNVGCEDTKRIVEIHPARRMELPFTEDEERNRFEEKNQEFNFERVPVLL